MPPAYSIYAIAPVRHRTFTAHALLSRKAHARLSYRRFTDRRFSDALRKRWRQLAALQGRFASIVNTITTIIRDTLAAPAPAL